MTGGWLVPWHAEPARHPVLLCLPQAGSGCGQFRAWQGFLGEEVSVVGVQLPGRENRFAEPPVATVDDAVRGIVTALTALLPEPTPLVVFGHSLGALLGYEVARRLRDEHGRAPQALVVAAARPPHASGAAAGSMGDADTDLASLVDGQDLDEDTRELMLDLLRQDARLSATYQETGGAPIPCGLYAWGGDSDEIVSAEHLDGWRDYASGPFHRWQFPGGHDFCTARADLVLPLLRDMITCPVGETP